MPHPPCPHSTHRPPAAVAALDDDIRRKGKQVLRMSDSILPQLVHAKSCILPELKQCWNGNNKMSKFIHMSSLWFQCLKCCLHDPLAFIISWANRGYTWWSHTIDNLNPREHLEWLTALHIHPSGPLQSLAQTQLTHERDPVWVTAHVSASRSSDCVMCVKIKFHPARVHLMTGVSQDFS